MISSSTAHQPGEKMQTLSPQATRTDNLQVIGELNASKCRTLKAIYQNPVLANIAWTDIESLFIALGAIVREKNGSRVCIALNGVKAVFHKPHPQKEVSQGAVRSVREFLKKAGIVPVSEQ